MDIFPESVLSHTKKGSCVYKIVAWLSRRIYRACDLIGVTSRSFIEYHSEVNGIDASVQVYIPQHADNALLSLPLKTAQTSHVDFLFAGNIGFAQNLDVVIDAVKLLHDEYDLTVHIVGDGSKLGELQQYAHEKGVEKRFIFHGRVPRSKMASYYGMADVLLLTLRGNNRVGDTLPGKLQTYMTAGRPIIAAVNGSTADVIREAQCGICVPAGDPEKLKEAMEQYMEHPERYSNCGLCARRFFSQNFTFDIFMRKLNETLQQLVE